MRHPEVTETIKSFSLEPFISDSDDDPYNLLKFIDSTRWNHNSEKSLKRQIESIELQNEASCERNYLDMDGDEVSLADKPSEWLLKHLALS